MRQRFLSTLILWLTFAGTLLILDIPGAISVIILLAFLTQYEVYQLLEHAGTKPWKRLGLSCGLLITVGTGLMPAAATSSVGSVLLFISLLVLSSSLLIRPIHTQTLYSFMGTLTGLLYTPFTLQFYILLLKDFQRDGRPTMGLFLLIWLILVAKFTDVGGLWIGRRFGRTHLLPLVSPRKTREGALGGIAIAFGIGTLFVAVFRPYFPEDVSPLMAGLLAIPVALLAITSDLFASFLKRQAKVKDSGVLIPGIGGVLDLTDSLLLTAPLGYLLFCIL